MTLQDARSTIHEIADAERRRRGRLAGLWAEGREWLSLALAIVAARFGRRARITAGPPQPRPPRRPSMITVDLHHGWRRVTARPGTSLLAVGMLGAGIGLTTAMFTIADALLLRPVPFHDPDRLAAVQTRSKNTSRSAAPPAVFRAWRDSGVFEAVEAATTRGTSAPVTLETGGDLVMRNSARVSSGLFAMLGVRPIRGRGFLPDEGRAGTADRVILSETVWRTLFSAAPDLVGRQIPIDGRPHLVVGIMPAEFRFPQWDTVIWRPLDYLAPPPDLSDELPRVYVRWSSQIPATDVAARAADVMREADASLAKLWVQLNPVVSAANRDEYYKRAVPMLTAGVGLVFLVLCANVSGLLLAQLTTRRQEYSVCSALGAGRSRLVRQALAESALLGAAGVVAGVGLAWGLVSLARGYLPEAFLLRSLNPLNLDERALLAAGAVGFLATMLAGVLPAWIGTAVDGAGALRAIERAGTETRPARLASRALLVVEIALACALLSGATLLVRSFVNLAGADRALRTEGVTTAWLTLPASAKDTASREILATAVEEAMRSMPGVTAATLSLGLPPGGGGSHHYDDWRSDVPGAAPVNPGIVSEYYVRPDFFTLYGIPVLRGRTFQAGDADTAVVIGEWLAAKLWPNQDPVGRWFTFGKRQLQVVGLAREITLPTLEAREDRPEFYTPFTPGGSQFMLSVACSSGCPSIPLMRRRIETTSAGLRIVSMTRLDDEYAGHLARPRAAAALGAVFAIVAVVAAAGGLFSVLTYAVSRRRREFGIRTAIGASQVQIRRLVVRDGAAVATVGVALGGVAAWALGRAMTAFQYGVTPNDPLTWGLVLVVVGATTLVASWRPARQAMRVNPVNLLREE